MRSLRQAVRARIRESRPRVRDASCRLARRAGGRQRRRPHAPSASSPRSARSSSGWARRSSAGPISNAGSTSSARWRKTSSSSATFPPRPRRFLHLRALDQPARLQGDADRRRSSAITTSTCRTRAFTSPLAMVHSPLLHQHVPVLAAGPPVPDARPQRRDQHPSRQPQLDARPHRVAPVRSLRRRTAEDVPASSPNPAATRPRSTTRCSSWPTTAGRWPTRC